MLTIIIINNNNIIIKTIMLRESCRGSLLLLLPLQYVKYSCGRVNCDVKGSMLDDK